MNAVSIRGDWVGRKIDGRFPLIAWLGGSGSTGVFLTEITDLPHGADGSPSTSEPRKAAIKLIAASPQAEDQLATWTRTAALSHPHLVRILHSSHATIDGAQIVYVVTELADEVLAQIIPERALTADETREMLGPILDALAYVHSSRYIHGHLKPSNILVVDNEVKLSSDALLIAGMTAQEVFSNDLHNAPEIASEPLTPAADVWSLGVTLVEALTQQLPIWDAATDSEADVPGTLPSPFSEIVDKCLHADPARRCTLDEIRAILDGKSRPANQFRTAPVSHAPERSHNLAEPSAPPKVPLVPLIVGFILLIAIIIGLAMRSHKTDSAPMQTETAQQAPPAEPESHATPQQLPSGGTGAAEVIDRAMPDVPRAASNTIHGKIPVVVRVTVNETGSVSNAELTSPGPSAYFARLALESARNWKFKPAQRNGKPAASTWMLHYEFRRDGTDVKPAQSAP
ncbi:MAG TPA: TonB family protein [Terracidiphilus sp.]|jgi:TonB family protein